jgi:hypothetical protein
MNLLPSLLHLRLIQASKATEELRMPLGAFIGRIEVI